MGPLDQRLTVTDDARLASFGPGLTSVLNQRLKAAGDDWYKGKSEIAGQGVFAARDYNTGDKVGICMVDGDEDEFGAKIWNLTELGRYCNHQDKNNVEIKKNEEGDRFHLVATGPIEQDDELVSDYWQVGRAIGPHSRMHWEGKPVPTADEDEYIELEKAAAKKKSKFVHSCCDKPAGECSGCSEGMQLVVRE